MSKIICDLCGTAYPETATRCPICGCVRPADAQGIPSDSNETAPARKYEQVKGGRFSKENVRKRTMGSQAGTYSKPAKAVTEAPAKPKKKKKKTNSFMGLIITILVLLLAIIAVVAYIIIKFFVPTSAPDDVPVVPTDPIVTEQPLEQTEETLELISCQDLALDTYEIVLENAGDHTYLVATASPIDTTEEIIFESADNSIAMVESDGRVTAVSKGETFITVSCGIVSTQCKVTVGVVKEEFRLNRQEITFEKAGDTWNVYSGNLPMDEISWTSDDDSIAKVENGVVTAVSSGVTMIYGNYDGQILSCVIRCSFVENETENGTNGNGDVSSDADTTPTDPTETQPVNSEYTGPFKLKNLVGVSAEDVMISVGESFSLALIDSNGKTVKGVSWSVDGSACSVTDGKVSGLRSGYCEIVATYEGQTYKCIVRVK